MDITDKIVLNTTETQAKSTQLLLGELRNRRSKKGYSPLAKVLHFDLGVNESITNLTTPFGSESSHPLAAEVSVYNITRPFKASGPRRLAGRTESRHSETDSRVVFFEEEVHDHVWKPVVGAPVLSMQDPFHIENVQGFNIIGGVETWELPDKPGYLTYRTIFFRYKDSIDELISAENKLVMPFAVGPDGMKDIRLIELSDGRVGVFTRPQGPTPATGGRGKIGYVEIDTLDELGTAVIAGAPIIDGLFLDTEWGGANELHLLRNGIIGVLGHIAEYSAEGKNYYPITFVFDPETGVASGIKIIAEADNFPNHVGTKMAALHKVMFSGGITRNPEGDALLYCGVGDVAAGLVYLDDDPFLEYEQCEPT